MTDSLKWSCQCLNWDAASLQGGALMPGALWRKQCAQLQGTWSSWAPKGNHRSLSVFREILVRKLGDVQKALSGLNWDLVLTGIEENLKTVTGIMVLKYGERGSLILVNFFLFSFRWPTKKLNTSLWIVCLGPNFHSFLNKIFSPRLIRATTLRLLVNGKTG